jgi:hypothetical protein
MRGERFSIFTSGQMEFIRVPYESTSDQANFTVNAKIETVGAISDKCLPHYITGLLFGGHWFKDKPLEVSVDVIKRGATKKGLRVFYGRVPVLPSSKLIDIGPGDMHIALEMRNNTKLAVWIGDARVVANLNYYFLNVEANAFSSLAPQIGGLLGEDDHAAVSAKPLGCNGFSHS